MYLELIQYCFNLDECNAFLKTIFNYVLSALTKLMVENTYFSGR